MWGLWWITQRIIQRAGAAGGIPPEVVVRVPVSPDVSIAVEGLPSTSIPVTSARVSIPVDPSVTIETE